ncbi:MAG: hypothetical protein FJZ80_00775 [Bacteroidetes bacterium]|nr:hypothetical protein [Bacteroidota bacterium]MBM3424642.1 hypothetical protein [Bacteroidota bacterium]
MKHFFFALAVFFAAQVAIGQNTDNDQSLASNRDVIHFNNGVSLNCEVVEVAENIVFYEQIPSSGLLSASLSEVKELELGVEGLCTLSDSTKNFKRDPLYRQGKRDAKRYYKLRHKSSFQTPKNPRNSMLSNPTYEAGYKAGAKSKETWFAVILPLTLLAVILPLTLLLLLAILAAGSSGGGPWF